MNTLDRLRSNLEKHKNSLDVKKETLRNVVTGLFYKVMKEENINKDTLAKKMGISNAAVTMFLSGDRNFTLDKMTEVSHHLKRTPHIVLVRNDDVPFISKSISYSCEEIHKETIADFSIGFVKKSITYKKVTLDISSTYQNAEEHGTLAKV